MGSVRAMKGEVLTLGAAALKARNTLKRDRNTTQGGGLKDASKEGKKEKNRR